MDMGQLALLLFAMALMAFTLGAAVAWRLEGRRPLVAPIWLIVARNLSFIVMTLFIAVTADVPSRIISVDPLWWNVLKALLVIGSVVVLPIELRHALQSRQSKGARGSRW